MPVLERHVPLITVSIPYLYHVEIDLIACFTVFLLSLPISLCDCIHSRLMSVFLLSRVL